METPQGHVSCQIPSLQSMSEGHAQVPRPSLLRLMKLAVRRRLSPRQERTFKARTNELMNQVARLLGRETRPATTIASVGLKAGDQVRVRSREEIEATLNHWGQLRGCSFMAEMAQYCDTTQRVHKVMERFVDERDLRVKKVKGIVLLDGLRCEGTAEFGRCDRSCLYFWREEWLERIE
jgi:hypothetical protein